MVSAMGIAVDTVEAEVRELVRRRGLDPVEDRLAMRRLIDEVVLDYDERALSSTMPPLPDPRQAARAVYDAVAGFGPLQRNLGSSNLRGKAPSAGGGPASIAGCRGTVLDGVDSPGSGSRMRCVRRSSRSGSWPPCRRW